MAPRCFCYQSDLIDGFLRLMATGPDVTGPINLGKPGEFTIRQLAEAVFELTDGASRLAFNPLTSDDPMQRRPDIRLACEHLGWAPTVALLEGLGHTIAYFD